VDPWGVDNRKRQAETPRKQDNKHFSIPLFRLEILNPAERLCGIEPPVIPDDTIPEDKESEVEAPPRKRQRRVHSESHREHHNSPQLV